MLQVCGVCPAKSLKWYFGHYNKCHVKSIAWWLRGLRCGAALSVLPVKILHKVVNVCEMRVCLCWGAATISRGSSVAPGGWDSSWGVAKLNGLWVVLCGASCPCWGAGVCYVVASVSGKMRSLCWEAAIVC